MSLAKGSASTLVASLGELLSMVVAIKWPRLNIVAVHQGATSGVPLWSTAVRSSLSSISVDGLHTVRLENLLLAVLRLRWGPGLLNHVRRLVQSCVHAGSNSVHLLFPVQVSSNDVISFNKGVQFSLQVSVLLSEES
jgi:hypothetical protein